MITFSDLNKVKEHLAPIVQPKYLHFIGRHTYSIPAYIEESKRLGVHRAFPVNFVKGIEYGTPILLASWRNDEATVFGYFIVSGISIACDDTLVLSSIKSYLNTSNEDTSESFEEDSTDLSDCEKVERDCGEYYIVTSCNTTSPLSDTCDAIKGHSEDSEDQIKVFLTGEFVPLEQFIINPCGFTRTAFYLGDVPLRTRCVPTLSLLTEYKKK